MKVSLEELKDKKTIEGNYQDSSLAEGLNYRIEKPIETYFLLNLLDNNVSFNLKASGELYFECDRCLEKFIHQLKIDEHSVFTLEEFGEELDITDELRQNIRLSIPLKLLCKESCQGLCPECGKNLNSGKCGCKKEYFNPKFEKLKNLKF
ncbi:MAG: DUF177 domain-containing protein [Elusimicrobia bacterium]|nr:DUF177 domain-containing protein [Elusimicrobiota bacterium]MBU2615416.1 DUF177 domain-containing protein [Elusimicrobiota bacterium]